MHISCHINHKCINVNLYGYLCKQYTQSSIIATSYIYKNIEMNNNNKQTTIIK